MKKYKRNNKGFSFIAFLIIVCILGVAAYYGFQMYQEKNAKIKFYALKDFTEKLANHVGYYSLVNGKYPDKISDLDIGLEVGYEGPSFLIGKGPDDIWCFIPKHEEPVSCTQKILGGRIGFFTNVKDVSAKCVTFNNLKKDELNNRLCKQEFKDYSPILMYCENYSYVLSRKKMIRNVLPPNCKELLNKNKI